MASSKGRLALAESDPRHDVRGLRTPLRHHAIAMLEALWSAARPSGHAEHTVFTVTSALFRSILAPAGETHSAQLIHRADFSTTGLRQVRLPRSYVYREFILSHFVVDSSVFRVEPRRSPPASPPSRESGLARRTASPAPPAATTRAPVPAMGTYSKSLGIASMVLLLHATLRRNPNSIRLSSVHLTLEAYPGLPVGILNPCSCKDR